MNLFGPLNTGDTTGGAGTSTSNATSSVRICGEVKGVYVRYNGSPPAGSTDLTVATSGTSHPAVTILTLSNAATDGWHYPRIGVESTAGAAMLYAGGGTAIPGCIPIADFVKVTIAQANDADSADIWLLFD